MRGILLGLALAACQGTAWAADKDPAALKLPLIGPSGYIDIHAGYGWGDENGTFDDGAFSYEESWSEADFGGAGRALFRSLRA
jgi:hypothetical protein